jgi:glucose-1-phosphate adenylyltransferase
MDYAKFVEHHRATGADITIGCLPVDPERASDFGLMKVDTGGKVVEFAEKPKGAELEAMQVDTTALGLSAEEAKDKPYIASMGIYVFKKSVLTDLLTAKYADCNDFGGEIIPKYAASSGAHVGAYLFTGYWEDIGTIKSFFDANLALAQHPPRFEFYDPAAPIYTSPRFLPPAQITDCQVTEAIISHGVALDKATVEHAIIGLRSRVEAGAVIKDAMLIGADYYEDAAERASVRAKGGVPIGVGPRSVVQNAIVDKNARIGADCRIVNEAGVEEADHEADGYYIRSGIVVVLRNATIPDGTVI